MKEEELRKKVDAIIAKEYPTEKKHSDEDDLYLELLMLYLPAELIKHVIRLQKADFPRWYS
jgi:hypothetical protein